MKRFLSLLLAALLTTALLTGCGEEEVSDPSELKFTTGGVTGTYYAFGGLLAGQAQKYDPDSKIVAIEGKGSEGNMMLLDMGGAQLGFVQSDVISYAYAGTNLFAETGKIDGISTVAALYTEQVHIITCDPDIRTVEDLRGKNVSVGTAGSGVYYNAVDVLGIYGMDVEKDIKAKHLGFSESTDALKDHKIDAAFVVAGMPTPAITELSATRETYLVGLDDAHADALIEKSPYYKKTVIPADMYKMDRDVTTVSVSAVVAARDDVPDEAIYNFLSAVFEHTDELAANHPKGKELDLDFAASITSVPYHPGAAAYFKEKGIDVPVKHAPPAAKETPAE